jgi:hypothetical protein
LIGSNHKITVLALEPDPNAYNDFYQAIEKTSGLVIYPTLEGLLSDDPRSENTILLLDINALKGSPTAMITQLLDRRSRQRIGLTSGREMEEHLYDLRRWGVFQVAIKCAPISEDEVSLFLECVRNPADGFGLSRYLNNTVEMYNLSVDTFEEKNRSIERVMNHFAPPASKSTNCSTSASSSRKPSTTPSSRFKNPKGRRNTSSRTSDSSNPATRSASSTATTPSSPVHRHRQCRRPHHPHHPQSPRATVQQRGDVRRTRTWPLPRPPHVLAPHLQHRAPQAHPTHRPLRRIPPHQPPKPFMINYVGDDIIPEFNEDLELD